MSKTDCCVQGVSVLLRLIKLGLTALVLFVFSCDGSPVARTTGSIQVEFEWSGQWPQDGSLVAALFKIPPWDPDFEPKAPAASAQVPESQTQIARLLAPIPGIKFGTYGSFTIAWNDPQATDLSTKMLPISVYGTTLDNLQNAAQIHLTEQQPDLVLTLPGVVLYPSAGEMRNHYKPVE